MTTDPTSLSLAWSPFGNHDASAKNVFSDGLRLGGLAGAPLRFGRAPDSISLTTDGHITDKTVVSEVTTVAIHANSTENVTTESADQAKADAKAGTVLDETARADGNVDVATADTTSKFNNGGSIEVDTKITYSDGTTEKSTASLGSNFTTAGDGIARKRLDAIVGASLSIGAILKKLGLPSTDGSAAVSSGVPAKTAVDAHVSSNLAVALTYTQSGDQRAVHGTETGTASAVIASFAPTDLTYSPNGQTSTTNESVRFGGTISGGSLFSDSSAAWLAGAVTESTASSTHIPGSTDVTIARQASASFAFNTNAGSALVQLRSDVATEITATTDVANGHGGWNQQQITWAQSQTQSDEQFSSGGNTTSTGKSAQTDTLSITSTPITGATAFAATSLTPTISTSA
jgi:hypothetical protein